MSSRRLLVAATTNDALSDQDIRTIETASVVNLWAGCVTLTDTIGLRLDKTIILDDSIVNIRAAAISVNLISDDQIVFDTVVGPGTLRVPVTVTTSLIFTISVEPIL